MWNVAAHKRSDEDRDVEPGMLLVASPDLLDPNFRRTVVYVIEHHPEGTLGVVLNRPSDVSMQEVLPAWEPHSIRPKAVFVGGPVDAKSALCLAAFLPGHDLRTIGGVIAVRGPVGLIDLDSDPATLGPRMRGLRVFAGYAGWNSGQLGGELSRGDWILVPALPDDVLATGTGDLWGRVLRRQGMPLALLSTYPADVSCN
jgi:putative transcriptional regulator